MRPKNVTPKRTCPVLDRTDTATRARGEIESVHRWQTQKCHNWQPQSLPKALALTRTDVAFAIVGLEIGKIKLPHRLFRPAAFGKFKQTHAIYRV
jgi:hypothetical protein